MGGKQNYTISTKCNFMIIIFSRVDNFAKMTRASKYQEKYCGIHIIVLLLFNVTKHFDAIINKINFIIYSLFFTSK